MTTEIPKRQPLELLIDDLILEAAQRTDGQFFLREVEKNDDGVAVRPCKWSECMDLRNALKGKRNTLLSEPTDNIRRNERLMADLEHEILEVNRRLGNFHPKDIVSRITDKYGTDPNRVIRHYVDRAWETSSLHHFSRNASSKTYAVIGPCYCCVKCVEKYKVRVFDPEAKRPEEVEGLLSSVVAYRKLNPTCVAVAANKKAVTKSSDVGCEALLRKGFEKRYELQEESVDFCSVDYIRMAFETVELALAEAINGNDYSKLECLLIQN